jgi:hypothetical protein
MKSITENSPALEAMKTSLNNLRERIQEAARSDERFSKPADGAANSAGPCSCWVDDVLEEGESFLFGGPRYAAIINAADGKCYEVAVMLADGKATLGEAKEVIRQTNYTPVSAAESDAANENMPLEAGMAVTAPVTASGEFMFMPAGVHFCSLSRGGKPLDIVVNVTQSAASALQAQLTAVSSRSAHKPFLDFNHRREAASFWPSAFAWKESPQPGVYVRGEWSKTGKEAVEGKSYRAFSPTFHTDAEIRAKKTLNGPEWSIAANARGSEANPAEIICEPNAGLCFGGLVNNPAFEAIRPLTARRAENQLPTAGAVGSQNQKNKNGAPAPPNNMRTLEQIQADKAALEARQSQLEAKITALEAQSGDTNAAIQLIEAKGELKELALQKELAAAREKNVALEAAETKRREENADRAVERLKLAGKIAMLDKDMAAQYRQKFINDPSLIELMAGKETAQPGLDARRTPASPSLDGQGNQRLGISREATRAVLNGMLEANKKNRFGTSLDAKKLAARDFAALFASEITPRIREGDDIPIPLDADNSFGTLSQTIVAVAVLERLFLEFPLLKSIFTDFSDQIVNYGDVLKTRVVGIPSVVTYHQVNGWSNSDMQTTDVSMTYDQKKGVQIAIDDQTLGSTVRRLFEEIVPGQAYALGKDMVDYIYALITAAYTNTITAAGLGTFGRATVVDIGGILDDAANPEMGRTLLLNRPYFSALEKDPTIVNLATFQRAEIIEKGTLPDVGGFKVIKAVNLPNTAIGAAVLKGFGFTKSAIVLASRLGADYMRQMADAANGSLQVVTTPAGFSANMVRFVDNKLGAAYQRLEVIYAGSRGQVAAGALLTDV